jgi:Starch-binding associating with outer membrane
MKKIILIAFTAIFLNVSCDTSLDVNRDPDSISDAPLSSQLPSGVLGLVAAEGTYYALVGGFWSQYWTQSPGSNQYKDIDGYVIGSGDLFGAWAAMYDALGDIRNVKRKALETENWNYYLIATALEVQGSQIMTDFYGDIPYSEANNRNILQPKYDKSENVYDFMISDLNNALSKNLTTSKGNIPANDDLIFAGNMSKWTAFANTLKLKVYMRQTNSSRSSIASAGISNLLTSGVAFLNVDASLVQFIDSPNQSNPLYESDRRQLNVGTNLKMSRTMESFLTANGDGRKSKYYGVGAFVIQGDFEQNVPQNTFATVSLSATTPAFLMSKEESLFLQAEAQARYGTAITAKTLYNDAIASNFARYSLISSALTDVGGAYEYPLTGSTNDQIKSIITQKWVAGFPGNGFEAFFDTNRTGFPKKSTVTQTSPTYIPGELCYSVNGVTGAGKFPRRIVYPQEEATTNSNTPSIATFKITTPIWWDQN